jgi:hypothetical protein
MLAEIEVHVTKYRRTDNGGRLVMAQDNEVDQVQQDLVDVAGNCSRSL